MYTLDELLDKEFGKIGSPSRDAFEAEIAAEMETYRLGESAKEARLSQCLSQEQLGQKAGIARSQISRIENGKDVSFGTLKRVFRALGIPPAVINAPGFDNVALW